MLLEPLFAHAKASPDEIAIHDDAGDHTWRQLAGRVVALSRLIGTTTHQPRVGLLLPAGAGFVTSFYATLLTGKTVVPINFLLGDREVAHVIADSGIDAVITIGQLGARLAADGQLKIIDLAALAAATSSAPATAAPAEPAPAGTGKPDAPALPAPRADDVAVLMYTSGTAGLPKGVILTHQNLHADVTAAIAHARLEGQHRFLGIVPLFHSTGLLATMLAPIQLGALAVYIARFSPVATLNVIRSYKLSVLVAVPSMYGALVRLKDAGPQDFAHVYACISGGEPLSPTIAKAWLDRFHVPIYEGYGLTETIGPIAFNYPAAYRAGSVGTLIPTAQIRFIDDTGKSADAQAGGEIELKGPMIMRGYHNRAEETAAALTTDGYFKTGDLGRLDADGYLYITGRKKDLVIVAGEKVTPREVEDVLMRHPAIADAAVVGRPDPSRGEAVAAFVIFKEGQTAKPEELKTFCRDQGLTSFKIPRDIIIETELPRSPTGKVLKRVLAEKARAHQG